MKIRNLTWFIIAIVLLINGQMVSAQVPGAPKPIPESGILIEPVQANGVPEANFTNSTNEEIIIQYGTHKIVLKAGESRMVQFPNHASLISKYR
jgi:hypothetical protein